MKKVMYLLGVMMAVVLAGVNVFFVVQDGRKEFLNVEQTHASMSGNGVEDCDIYLYQRHASEAYSPMTTFKGQIVINGEVRYSANIGGSVEGEVTVRVPVCDNAPENCCKKSHLTSAVLCP